MNTFWLDLASSAVAIAASLAGVLVAVSQLTSTSRLRRDSKFWSEQMQSMDLEQDRAVAQSLCRDATARLIALQAYPARKVFAWVFLALLSVYSVGAAGHAAGTLATGDYTYRTFQEQGLDPASTILLGVVIFNLALVQVSAVVERRGILAQRYLEGLGLTTSPQLDERREDAPVGRRQSCLGFMGVMGFGLGIFLLVAVMSFAIGLPKGDAPDASTIPDWLFIPLVVGVPLALAGLSPVLDMFHPERIDWVHPRALPLQPEIPQTDERLSWVKRLRLRFGQLRG